MIEQKVKAVRSAIAMPAQAARRIGHHHLARAPLVAQQLATLKAADAFGRDIDGSAPPVAVMAAAARDFPSFDGEGIGSWTGSELLRPHKA